MDKPTTRKDTRNRQPAIPKNINDYLSPKQQAVVPNLGNFGWQLHFVRRPAFQESVVVVKNVDGRTIGILEQDGRINLDVKITLRD